jgi:hypothetical protein
MSRYATDQEVTQFFAAQGIEVTHVRREGPLRHLQVHGQPLTLPMPASPEECLRLVRDCIARTAARKGKGPSPLG